MTFWTECDTKLFLYYRTLLEHIGYAFHWMENPHYNWPICSPQTFANASCEYTCGKVKNHYKKHFIYLKHKNSECYNLRLKHSQWCHIRCTHRCQDLTLGYAWNGSGHFKTNFAISFPTPKARIREAKISTWRQPQPETWSEINSVFNLKVRCLINAWLIPLGCQSLCIVIFKVW